MSEEIWLIDRESVTVSKIKIWLFDFDYFKNV